MTVSQLPPPKPSEIATLTSARPVKAVIYLPEVKDKVDKTIICGGGDEEDYKPLGVYYNGKRTQDEMP